MNEKEINWIWHGRRKMSVHHLDIFFSGLSKNGFEPILDFMQNNQLSIMLPSGDTYLFNDEDELNKLYNSILEQTEKDDFAQKLYKKNNDLFGSLLLLSGDIRKSNLSLYSKRKIIEIYDEFINRITQAPLIRVQLVGIDACWSDKSFLNRELKEKANSSKQYKKWIEAMSHFQGLSVAKAEETDFLLLVSEFYKETAIKELLEKKEIKSAIKLITDQYKFLGKLLKNHMAKYEWVNSEYTGEKWDINRWMKEISQFIKKDPLEKLRKIEEEEKGKSLEKRNLIKQLSLDKKSLRIVEALDCFSTIRDWSKGYYVRALLDYRFLLNEMAKRIKVDFEDLLYFSIKEIRDMFENDNFNQEELEERKKEGVAVLIENGEKAIYTKQNDLERIKDIDAVKEMLSQKEKTKEFKGRTGYPGKVKGKVRVVLDSKDINEVEEGDILVTYMTTMEFTSVFKKISALVTDEGGISSHAAIISREFKIPCIVGSQVATRVLKSGDLIEVDADSGIVRLLDNV